MPRQFTLKLEEHQITKPDGTIIAPVTAQFITGAHIHIALEALENLETCSAEDAERRKHLLQFLTTALA